METHNSHSSMEHFMKHTILAIMILSSLLATTTQTTFSQGTIYTSRTLFEQQLGSSTTITMESLPASTPADFEGAQGKRSITVAGVSFETISATLYVTAPSNSAYPIPGDGQYIWNFDSDSPVSILLPGGVTAFGADFSGGLEPNPSFNATLTANLTGGGSYAYNFSGARGSWVFFGVTFEEPILSLIYDDGGTFLHEEMLDNVTFGNVVPEPRSLALLLVGLMLLLSRTRSHIHCPSGHGKAKIQ